MATSSRRTDDDAIAPGVATPRASGLLAPLLDDAPPIERRLLASLLGVLAIKDLMVSDVPRMLLAQEGELRLPFFSFAKPLLYSQWGDAACFALHVAAFGCALLLIAGRYARVAAAALAALYLATFLSDQLAYTNNVFLFIVLLGLCAIEPLDPEHPSPRYPTFLVRALVTVIYAVGALVKLDGNWRSGYILGEACLHYHFAYAKNFGLNVDWLFRWLALVSLFVEGALAIALWRKSMRKYAIVVGVLFHFFVEMLLPVRIFSWEMMAVYVVFLDRDELEAVHAWWSRKGTLSRAMLGVLVALVINATFTWLFQISTLPPRHQIALAMAASSFVGAWVLFPTLRAPDSGGATVVRRGARLPLVAALVGLELFAIVKPALGYTNRFGWRMFTEVLRLRVEAQALEGGGWSDAPLDEYWSRYDLRYHWDSLGEQRNLLRGYGDWLLAGHADYRAVRLKLVYERNGEPEQQETIELARP